MQDHDYSFLDLTVMPFLRRRVISPDAAVLFDRDFKRVLWANAVGTNLFGGNAVGDLIGIDLPADNQITRQLRNAAAQLGGTMRIVRKFRISRGLRSEIVQGTLSIAHLPDDSEAVLLICDDLPARDRYREHELAQLAVDSLEGFADAAAIVDEFGLPLASTDDFDSMGIDADELQGLVTIAAREDDRLVKRPLTSESGNLVAAGIGRVRDMPGRYLIVLADAGAAEDTDDFDDDLEEEYPEELAGTSAPEPASHLIDEPEYETSPEAMEESPDEDETGDAPEEAARLDETEAEDEADEPAAETGAHSEAPSGTDPDLDPRLGTGMIPGMGHGSSLVDRWYFWADDKPAGEAGNEETHELDFEPGEDREPLQATSGSSEDAAYPGEPELPETDDNESEAFEDEDGVLKEEALEDGYPDDGEFEDEAPASAYDGAHDEIDEDHLEDGGAGEAPALEKQDQEDDRPAAPAAGSGSVRFAFSIDKDGVFRSVSPELAETVGEGPADIADKSWEAVARALGFDETGAIAQLLKKADTWSGRSVLWPVEDSDMAMPVDLAALPIFDRERNFEGFKGFGIIRTADAVVDPEARGDEAAERLKNVRQGSAGDTGLTQRFEPSIHAPEDEQPEDVPLVTGWRGDVTDEDDGTENSPSRPLIDPGQVKVSSPGNNVSAKVVRLETRRNQEKQEDGDGEKLSSKEAAAFNEIARSLDKSGSKDRPDAEKDAAGEDASRETGTESGMETAGSSIPAFGKRSVPLTPDHNGDTDEDGSEPTPGRLTAEENQQLLEELPVPVLVYRAGQALFANHALLKETGYTSLEEIADAGGVDALLSSQADPEQGIAPVINLIRKDGSLRAITPNLKSINWQAGKALCLTFQPDQPGGAENVAAPQALASDPVGSLDMVRVSELQSILETAADGIIITDENGVIETVNGSGEALFSIRNAEMTGRQLSSLFAQESHQAIEEYVETIGAGGMARLMNDGREVIGIESSGGLIPLFLTIGKVGSNGRLCAVLRDLTEWKRTAGELVEARRKAELASEQKSEFLSRVSHEIREPLTTIIGFSDIMIEERFGPIGNPRYKEYLADINRSGVHVLDLVNDLLDISRIEAGKMEMTYEAVDLNKVAAETVALLQPQANAKRVIIRTSLSRAVPKIVADLRSMRQIIVNLLSNAIKYSPANSQIIVSTTFETNGEVALRVRDTGPGMSKEELARALEPFGRIDKKNEDGSTIKGSGLGLPLTKALVEANRAYFELESEQGEGTIAHVQFPAQRVLAD